MSVSIAVAGQTIIAKPSMLSNNYYISKSKGTKLQAAYGTTSL